MVENKYKVIIVYDIKKLVQQGKKKRKGENPMFNSCIHIETYNISMQNCVL